MYIFCSECLAQLQPFFSWKQSAFLISQNIEKNSLSRLSPTFLLNGSMCHHSFLLEQKIWRTPTYQRPPGQERVMYISFNSWFILQLFIYFFIILFIGPLSCQVTLLKLITQRCYLGSMANCLQALFFHMFI